MCEALKILDVAPNSNPREIDNAYNALRHKYVTTAQYSTMPAERDWAINALGLVQDAYRTVTGRSAPASIKPSHVAPTAPSSGIPRASLRGALPRSHAPASSRCRAVADQRSSPRGARRDKKSVSRFRNAAQRSWPTSVENVVASLICVAMFLVALTILTGGWGCAPRYTFSRETQNVSEKTFLPMFSRQAAGCHARFKGDSSCPS